jgi:hypothetical protein
LPAGSSNVYYNTKEYLYPKISRKYSYRRYAGLADSSQECGVGDSEKARDLA